MIPTARSVVVRVPEGVCWVKDSNQIIVVNEKVEEIHYLQDVEAIIWGWLSCSYRYSKLVELAAALLMKNGEETANVLSDVFKKWLALGIVEVFEERSSG